MKWFLLLTVVSVASAQLELTREEYEEFKRNPLSIAKILQRVIWEKLSFLSYHLNKEITCNPSGMCCKTGADGVMECSHITSVFRDSEIDEEYEDTETVEDPAEDPAITVEPVTAEEPAITVEPVTPEEPAITVEPVTAEEPAITVESVTAEEPAITVEQVDD